MELSQSKQKKEFLKSEVSLKDLWDNIKQADMCMIEVPEGEERQKGAENSSEE